MPISVSALRAIADAVMSAGADARAALEAVFRALEAQAVADLEDGRSEVKKRRADASKRKRLQRDREKSSPSVGSLRIPSVTCDHTPHVTNVPRVTRDSVTSPIPLPSSPTPPLTNPLTPLDDDDVRARGFLELAGRIANQAMEILGVDRENRPRLWHGFERDLALQLERGWRPDLILAAVRKVAASFAKRTGEKHPESFGYLTKPIENEHARYQRELALMAPIAAPDPAAIERARAAQTWLHRDDERFKAWDAHLVATRGRGLPIDGKGGWHVASDWPPGHPRASEAA